jgi:hypothetical protein
VATIQTFTAGQVLTAAQLNTLQDYVGVVQVKSATKTDTFTTSSTSYVDVTGLTVSITPTSASNKVFVLVSTTGAGTNGTNIAYLQLVRDSTAIALGDAAGVRAVATSGFGASSANNQYNSPMSQVMTTTTLAVLTANYPRQRSGL